MTYSPGFTRLRPPGLVIVGSGCIVSDTLTTTCDLLNVGKLANVVFMAGSKDEEQNTDIQTMNRSHLQIW